MGKTDLELNYLSKLLLLIMLVLSILLDLLSSRPENFIISIAKYILLLSSIIPVSLRVNLDFSKLVFCYMINNDKEIEAVA